METKRTIRPVNGIGPAVGMSPRDYLRERIAKLAPRAPRWPLILGLRKLSQDDPLAEAKDYARRNPDAFDPV